MAGLDPRKAIALQFDLRKKHIDRPDFVGAAKRGFNFGQEISRELERDPALEERERKAKVKKDEVDAKAKDLENRSLDLAMGLKSAAGNLSSILANTEEGSPERQAALQDPELTKHLGQFGNSLLTDEALMENIKAIETKLDPIESMKGRLRMEEDQTRIDEGKKSRAAQKEKTDAELGHKLKEHKLKLREQDRKESTLTKNDDDMKRDAMKNWRSSTQRVAMLEKSMEDLAKVEDSKFNGKLAGGVQQFFKDFLNIGDNDLQRFTQNFDGIVMTEATEKLRGLGPMTEMELKLARQTAPDKTNDPRIMKEWLMAKAKAARLESEYQEFTADYIEDNRSSDGLIKAWQDHAVGEYQKRQSINAKKQRSEQNPQQNPQQDQGTETSIEIKPGLYVSPEENAAIQGFAQELGITPEEAMRELGL